jgi:hypothetical protein
MRRKSEGKASDDQLIELAMYRARSNVDCNFVSAFGVRCVLLAYCVLIRSKDCWMVRA